MLLLKSDILDSFGLQFSPDGLSLLVASRDHVQVWPRWLDALPLPAVRVPDRLERFAFDPNGTRVYLYSSGNSCTNVLNVATSKIARTTISREGPAWFHFTADGGFTITSYGQGTLARYNHAPALKSRLRKAWSIDRITPGTATTEPNALGSHYRFGAIIAAAGVFVGLEFRYSGHEPSKGLVVRSVADGAIVYCKKLRQRVEDALLVYAGTQLTIHPSGKFFAYPHKADIRLHPLGRVAKIPSLLANVDGQEGKCQAVAFSPDGTQLAAAGDGGAVTLYDTATWRAVRTLAWQIGPLHAVCFTPDGTRAAALGTGGQVVVWDVDPW